MTALCPANRVYLPLLYFLPTIDSVDGAKERTVRTPPRFSILISRQPHPRLVYGPSSEIKETRSLLYPSHAQNGGREALAICFALTPGRIRSRASVTFLSLHRRSPRLQRPQQSPPPSQRQRTPLVPHNTKKTRKNADYRAKKTR